MNSLDWIRNLRLSFGFLKSGRFWLTVLAFVGVLCVVLSIVFWEWLVNDFWSWLGTKPAGREESNSATLRNVGLVIAAVVALPLAIWRSVIGSRQADTAERGLMNERYQKGAEMLESEFLSVRLGGIYALQQLAAEHPVRYHLQVMRLFCAFARNPAGSDSTEFEPYERDYDVLTPRSLREDVQAAMTAIAERKHPAIAIETRAGFTLNLRGAHLADAHLVNANLVGAMLREVNLTRAILVGADLSQAYLVQSDLSGAVLLDAKLFGTELIDTIVTGVDLYGVGDWHATKLPVQGLTQFELDRTLADFSDLPRLDGVVLDAETREPLIYRGEPIGF